MDKFNSIKSAFDIQYPSVSSSLQDEIFKKTKRNIPVRYEDALRTVNNDENVIKSLINYGVINEFGGLLFFDSVWQSTWDYVLDLDKEVNTTMIDGQIGFLMDNIKYWNIASSKERPEYESNIISCLRKITSYVRKAVSKLHELIDEEYKTQRNFQLKKAKLEDYDKDRIKILSQMEQTTDLINSDKIFSNNIESTSYSISLSEMRNVFTTARLELLNLEGQIIEYIIKLEKKSKFLRKLRWIGKQIDQGCLEDTTNILEVSAKMEGLMYEPQRRLSTKVDLDFLLYDSEAQPLLDDIRENISKVSIKPVDDIAKTVRVVIDANKTIPKDDKWWVDHDKIYEDFMQQENDLFSFVMNYQFKENPDTKERIEIFVRLAISYLTKNIETDKVKIPEEFGHFEKDLYLLIKH